MKHGGSFHSYVKLPEGIPKNIQKWKKMYGLALKSSKIDFKPTKHLQCSPTLDIVSYIVSYIVSAICIQCVLPGRQKSGLAGRLQWRSVEPSSLCPFRPRCHHFRPCPFLSLLRFYTFHLPSSVAPGR